MKPYFRKHHLPLIIVPLILFAPLLLTGKALVWGTVSTQFIPWWDFAWDTLMQGQIPLWNPWVGMGAPLVANYQSAIFYPPYWILFLIYGFAGIKWMAWGLTFIVVFHLIWSGFGLAKLLEEMGLGKLAQTIGGLAFSLSGYLVARAGFLSINAAVSWLPWILFISIRMVREKKNSDWLLGIVFAFQFLSGHAQTAWYSILISGSWVLFWTFRNSLVNNRWKAALISIRKFITAGLMGAGLSAVQIIPTVEYLLQSQRSGEYGYVEAMTYSFWPWRFLTLLVPDLFGNPSAGNYWGYGNFWEDAVYIGMLPILLAAGVAIRAIFNSEKMRDRNSPGSDKNIVLFLSGIVIISFFLALGDNTFLFPFLYRYIPTFGLFQAPTRFTIWAEISLSILAAIGVEKLTRPTGRRTYWTRLAAAGCFAIMVGAFLGWNFLSDVNSTFFVPIGLAGLFGLCTSLLILFQPPRNNNKQYRNWSALMIVLVAVDLVAAGWGLNPGVEKAFYEVGHVNEKIPRTYMAGDTEYDLKFNRYFTFDSFEPEVSWDEMHQDMIPNIPILHRKAMVNNFDPLVPGRYKIWMDSYDGLNSRDLHQMTDMMNIGQMISGSTDQIHKVNIEQGEEIRINDLLKISKDDQETLNEIINQEYDFRNSVIIAASPSAYKSNCGSKSDGEVMISDESPGYLKISSDLKSSSWVVWSQSWYPGWVGLIDGEVKVEVERANYLFQVICVPEGVHSVEIFYRPRSFVLGAGITLFCLAFVITGMVISRKKEAST